MLRHMRFGLNGNFLTIYIYIYTFKCLLFAVRHLLTLYCPKQTDHDEFKCLEVKLEKKNGSDQIPTILSILESKREK